jgi:hypothetical protein
MQLEKNKAALYLEANSFVAMSLNETGDAGEFIERVKLKINELKEYKNDFIEGVILHINKEKAWHDSLCVYEKCSVKDYFETCLAGLSLLSE